MLSKADLSEFLIEALRANGGSATIATICKYVWQRHKSALKNSEDLFYTWQYDIRWAATNLRKAGVMKSVKSSKPGKWELAQTSLASN